MVTYRYPISALAGDYARAGFGLLCAGAPLLFMNVASAMVWVLGGLSLLFATFGARTAIKHATTFELDAEGITARGPTTTSLRWAELSGVSLRYFSTRKDRENGWMQLILRGAGRSIRLDSTLEGFRDVVERAARTVQARGLTLDPPTIANFRAAGVPVADAA